MSAIYIHYGSKEFDKSKFTSIKNKEVMSKPEGGLWGSPADAEYGWKEWCKAQNFREYSEEKSFKFTLQENANVLQINSVEDLNGLPINDSLMSISAWVALDFEKLLSDGVDAIQVNISNDKSMGMDGLYFKLYGWDCDSILVMNKDVVKIIEEVDE